MTSALVTGFGPFPRVPRNPSQLLVERLADAIGDLTLHRRILPTDYRAAGPLIETLLDELRPDICLCIGVARAGDPLRLETTARNLGTVQTPDQSGFTFSGAIAAGAPETYAATLSLDRIHAALHERGHRVVLSNDAGGYVCNYVFFTAPPSHRAVRSVDRLRLPAYPRIRSGARRTCADRLLARRGPHNSDDCWGRLGGASG